MLNYKRYFIRNEKILFIIFLALFVFAVSEFNLKNVNSANLSLNYITTAKGRRHINEIAKNVFEKFGYTLIENTLVPFLKRKNRLTCEKIFKEWQDISLNSVITVPPKQMPDPEKFLLNYYSELKNYYFNDVPNNQEISIPVWNEAYIENLVNTVKTNLYGISSTYGNETLSVYYATKYFSVNGKVGAVVGTQIPWAEAYILANGAKNVTTIEYKKIKITHPKMKFSYAPDLPSLQKIYNNHFDFIVSYSSIEHSGLGRFGDPLDPIGDIREMNKIHCLLKNDGLLFLGFPIGKDAVHFNAHRVYGRMRLGMMFEGFQLLEVFYNDMQNPTKLSQKILENEGAQYLFVLRKINS